MQWNIENIIMIVINHLRFNQISASNDPWKDMPLNKYTKPKLNSIFNSYYAVKVSSSPSFQTLNSSRDL